MSTRIAFKLHGKYQDMALQLERQVNEDAAEVYKSQLKIRELRINEYKTEFSKWREANPELDTDHFVSTVEIPHIPDQPQYLSKETICERVFINWMISNIQKDTNERIGDTTGDNAAVSDSQDANSTALAESQEQAATA